MKHLIPKILLLTLLYCILLSILFLIQHLFLFQLSRSLPLYGSVVLFIYFAFLGFRVLRGYAVQFAIFLVALLILIVPVKNITGGVFSMVLYFNPPLRSAYVMQTGNMFMDAMESEDEESIKGMSSNEVFGCDGESIRIAKDVYGEYWGKELSNRVTEIAHSTHEDMDLFRASFNYEDGDKVDEGEITLVTLMDSRGRFYICGESI